MKTAVVRNVLRHSKDMGWPVENASIHRFNAKKVFGAAVDACLLVIECGGSDVIREILVFGSLATKEPLHVMGFSNSDLVADVHAYRAAPKLWAYLTGHRDVLDARRSSIYKGKPPFVIFGVGGYTFTDYKIAVSGLHKEPKFRLLGPMDGKLVIFDDTSYVLPCSYC